MKKRGVVVLFLLVLITIPSVFASEVFYLHPDYVGSPIGLTDGNGIAVEEYSYDPYGKRIVTLDAEVDNPIGFTGQRFDDSVGLNHFYFRTYDPELGRFLQRDPSGYADGVNLYEYVSGNPLGSVDGLGLGGELVRLGVTAEKLSTALKVPKDSIIPILRNNPDIAARFADRSIDEIIEILDNVEIAGMTGLGGVVDVNDRRTGTGFKFFTRSGKRGGLNRISKEATLAQYRENYPGVTRSPLKKQAPALYERLRRYGLLDEVPLAKKGKVPISREATLAQYRENYPGVTRGQLQDQAPALYERLRRYGLLDEVPLAKRSRKKGGVPPISPEATLAQYRENYPGVTRGRLAKMNRALYARLREHGLLDEVPLAKRSGGRGAISTYGNDPIAYYREHYPGVTRGQLRKVHRALYNRLSKDMLLGDIPLR